jgi:hypothetical protein
MEVSGQQMKYVYNILLGKPERKETLNVDMRIISE